jgi:cytochrome c biogenesis protein CcdA
VTDDKGGNIAQTIQLVKDYARQETLGPLRGAGRWLAFGIAGAILLGAAGAFAVLGVLRLMQNEFAPTFRGRWMALLPYVIALATAVVVAGLAASRIGKKSLHKEDR